MKQAIFKVEIHDDKEKKKLMDRVSGFSGVDSVSMDMKEKKLTVIGNIDPVNIVSKLKKLCHTQIVSVRPAKEPGKKNDDGKKKGGKELGKKTDDGKKKGGKEPEKKKDDGKKKGGKEPGKKTDDGKKKEGKKSAMKKDEGKEHVKMEYTISADDDTSACACVIL